jgi:sugar lactone lactonase YvrE
MNPAQYRSSRLFRQKQIPSSPPPGRARGKTGLKLRSEKQFHKSQSRVAAKVRQTILIFLFGARTMRCVVQSVICTAVTVAGILAFVAQPAVAGTVYAVSFSTGELIQYDSTDPSGTRTTLLTGGSLVSPAALIYGPDGNLYIGEDGDASTFAPRISRYEPATLTLSTVYEFSGFEVFPASFAFQGNDLLIGRNPFFGNTGPIVRLTNATGGTPTVSDYTTGGSLASSPGIALASDGRLYVSDQTYNFTSSIASGPVKRFDTSGTSVGELIADGSSGLAGPTGLAISGNTLYTASIMNGDILQTDLMTDITTEFASTGTPFEVGPLALLSDTSLLAGSPSGNGNIYHFGADGTLLNTFASDLGQVGGIATVTAVPEPSTLGLAAAGAFASAFWLRRRRTSNRE